MPILEIDGVGRVEVGKDFVSLPPDRQAAEVDAIVAQIKPPATPAADPRIEPGALTDEQVAVMGAEQNSPRPDSLKLRSSILPVGRDETGNLVPAVPGFIMGPAETVRDLLEGRRTADQISGREAFELGAAIAGGSPASAAGKAAGVAERAAVRTERIEPRLVENPAEPVPQRGNITVEPATGKPAYSEPTPQLKEQSKALYRQADESGVILKSDSFGKLADDIASAAKKSRADPTLTPDSVAVLKRLAEAKDRPVTFSDLDTLRQIAGDAMGAQRPNDRRVAALITRQIDDYVSKLSDKDVISGDAQGAAKAIVQARDIWSVVSKLDEVERLVERATSSAPNFSASGMENALRNEFRILSKNDRRMRTFTPQEQAAIKKIARGGAVQNSARNVGRFAPTGPVSAGLGIPGVAALGAMVGGPVGAAVTTGAAAGVTFGARQLAAALMKRNIRTLESTIRRTGDSPMVKAKLARSKEALEALARLSVAPSAQALDR